MMLEMKRKAMKRKVKPGTKRSVMTRSGAKSEKERRKREQRRAYHVGDAELFDLLERLREAHHKVTKVRRHIIERLQKAHEPKSIQEIAALVEVDETSVYRNVALFLELGVVEEIALPGEVKRYAVRHGHHHHVACTSCGRVEHVPCAPTKPKPITHPAFTAITGHELTYYGVCSRCG